MPNSVNSNKELNQIEKTLLRKLAENGDKIEIVNTKDGIRIYSIKRKEIFNIPKEK